MPQQRPPGVGAGRIEAELDAVSAEDVAELVRSSCELVADYLHNLKPTHIRSRPFDQVVGNGVVEPLGPRLKRLGEEDVDPAQGRCIGGCLRAGLVSP